MPRRIIVGAIGGGLPNGQDTKARAFGGAVTRAGCILLTGGVPSPSDLRDADRLASGEPEGSHGFHSQTKNATMLGALEAESGAPGSVLARLIGVLPSVDVEWDQTPRRLLLRTGLNHIERNVINGLTPDVVVVFGGSTGTLSELAYALAAGKSVVYRHAVDMLKSNWEKHSKDGELECFLARGLTRFPQIVGATWTMRGLLDRLQAALTTARDHGGDSESLIAGIIALVGSNRTAGTGFPGLPTDVDAKQRFEAAVMRMSDATLPPVTGASP